MKLYWCRWTRSPGTTASCFDIGVLDYDSTPFHTYWQSDRLKSVSVRIAEKLRKRGIIFRSVRKNYGVDANVVAENLKNCVRYEISYIP